MSPETASAVVKRLAAECGFDRCGVAAAEPIGRADYLRAWLEAGRAGSMAYLHRHFALRTDARNLVDGAKSVIVVALLYRRPQKAPTATGSAEPRGRVASYAWGDDYHVVVRERLRTMVDRLRELHDGPFDARTCVDTAPLLEREYAAAAGIGWIGKNTMILDHELGSFFFLGAVVTTLEIAPDEPLEDRCGTCTACLSACPTNAFPAAYEMDASRCISYLTIERRKEIPAGLAEKCGDWIFGCDVCQDVCPHNRRAPASREPRFAARLPCPEPALENVLNWTRDDYRAHTRGSAMRRATLDIFQRNARMALENHERGSRSANMIT